MSAELLAEAKVWKKTFEPTMRNAYDPSAFASWIDRVIARLEGDEETINRIEFLLLTWCERIAVRRPTDSIIIAEFRNTILNAFHSACPIPTMFDDNRKTELKPHLEGERKCPGCGSALYQDAAITGVYADCEPRKSPSGDGQPFSVGQRVECVDNQNSTLLNAGSIYEVMEIGSGDYADEIKVSSGWYVASRFRAVPAEQADAPKPDMSDVCADCMKEPCQCPPSGVDLIAAERQRQIEQEGWTPEHDDTHSHFEMSRAAECYLRYGIHPFWQGWVSPAMWPWDDKWWKPTGTNAIASLVKAGALIAAEIDRLNRAAQSKSPEQEYPSELVCTEVRPFEQFRIDDVVEWNRDIFKVTDVGCREHAGKIKTNCVDAWIPATEFTLKSRPDKEPIPSGFRYSIDGKFYDANGNCEGIGSLFYRRWIGRKDEFPTSLEDNVGEPLVHWESLSELPQGAWYRITCETSGNWYAITGVNAVRMVLLDVWYTLSELLESCEYSLNPFVGPGEKVVTKPCGKVATK